MKAGLALMLYAYDAIRRSGYTPTAPLFFQSVVEEECTGNGALACLQRGLQSRLCPHTRTDEAKAFASGKWVWSGFGCTCPGDPQHASWLSGGREQRNRKMHLAFGGILKEPRKEMERSESRATTL